MGFHRTAAVSAIMLAGIMTLAAVEAIAASMRFQNCTNDDILLHGFHRIDVINRVSWTTRMVMPGESGQAACIGEVCKVGVGPVQNFQMLDGLFSENHCIVFSGGKHHAYLPSSQNCIQACK